MLGGAGPIVHARARGPGRLLAPAPGRRGADHGDRADPRLRARSRAVDLTGRACGPCRACCTIGGVPSLSKPPETECPHSSCAGCAIYAARPQECHDYRCLWLDDAIGETDLDRPDQLGLMFDLPSLVQDHPDYAGIRVVCARETWVAARDGPRAADLLTRLSRSFVVRLTAPGGRTQLIGPRALIAQLVERAARRQAADGGLPG